MESPAADDLHIQHRMIPRTHTKVSAAGARPPPYPSRTPIIGAAPYGTADRQPYWSGYHQGVPCCWLFGDMSRLITRFLVRDSQPTMNE